jgi:hypothetical protein
MLVPHRPRFAAKGAFSSGPPAPRPAEPPTPQQLAAVRQFVARVGGIENARNALELLAILSAASRSKDAA